MKTAVDFLLEKITLKKSENDVYLYPRVTIEDIEQAKKMEKQQIVKAHDEGKNILPPNENGKQYYNETFKEKL